MRVALTISGIVLAFAAGCSSTGNRSPARPDPVLNTPNGSRPFWKDSDNRRSPTASIPNGNGMRLASADQTDVNGVLAGKLLDPVMNRRPTKAYILVAPADGSSKPVDVPADENGLFLIPGLVSGRTYMLTARTEEWGPMFVGRTQVAPPNSTLLIRMREGLATADVPPPPPPVGESTPRGTPRTAIPGKREAPRPPLPDLGTPTGMRQDDANHGWTPGNLNATAAPAPLGPAPGDPAADRENIAGGDGPTNPAVRPSPVISMPGVHSNPNIAPPPPDPTPGSSGSSMMPSRTSNRAAFAEISNNRLVNFGLPEIDGSFWEARHRHGKLLLVDFWTSWCGPCKKIIPQLREWERKYSYDGLEVIGVACDGLGPNEVQAVRAAQKQYSINYRVLLADQHDRDPVQRKFGVESYPTVFLIDQSGAVIAKANASNIANLEPLIQQRLRRN